MDFKKIFRTFAVMAATSILSFSFTSCGGDDEDGGDDPAKVQTPKSAMALYQFEASQDMINLLHTWIRVKSKRRT